MKQRNVWRAAVLSIMLSVVLGSISGYGKDLDRDSWETVPPAEFSPSHNCVDVDPALILPVPSQRRSVAIGRLENVPVVELSQHEAAAVLDINAAEISGAMRLEAAIAELAEQRRSALNEHHGSWPIASQERLDRLKALVTTPLVVALRPFPVRGVATSEGTGAVATMICDEHLVISHQSLGNRPPRAKRAPVVVFLDRLPGGVYVTSGVDE